MEGPEGLQDAECVRECFQRKRVLQMQKRNSKTAEAYGGPGRITGRRVRPGMLPEEKGLTNAEAELKSGAIYECSLDGRPEKSH